MVKYLVRENEIFKFTDLSIFHNFEKMRTLKKLCVFVKLCAPVTSEYVTFETFDLITIS